MICCIFSILCWFLSLSQISDNHHLKYWRIKVKIQFDHYTQIYMNASFRWRRSNCVINIMLGWQEIFKRFSVAGPAGFRSRDLLQTGAQRRDIHSAVRNSVLVVRKKSTCSTYIYYEHSTGWSEASMPTNAFQPLRNNSKLINPEFPLSLCIRT